METYRTGPNQTILITNHNEVVLYSYNRPVAGFKPLVGYFRVAEKQNDFTEHYIKLYLATTNKWVELMACEIELLWGN